MSRIIFSKLMEIATELDTIGGTVMADEVEEIAHKILAQVENEQELSTLETNTNDLDQATQQISTQILPKQKDLLLKRRQQQTLDQQLQNEQRALQQQQQIATQKIPVTIPMSG